MDTLQLCSLSTSFCVSNLWSICGGQLFVFFSMNPGMSQKYHPCMVYYLPKINPSCRHAYTVRPMDGMFLGMLWNTYKLSPLTVSDGIGTHKNPQTRCGRCFGTRHSAHVARQNRFSIKKLGLAAEGGWWVGVMLAGDERLIVNDKCFHKFFFFWLDATWVPRTKWFPQGGILWDLSFILWPKCYDWVLLELLNYDHCDPACIRESQHCTFKLHWSIQLYR